MPCTTLMEDALAPEGRSSSRGNSTREFCATRTVLLSSNSTSATPLPVCSRSPSITGRFAIALSKPLPVCRSSCTSPFTSLKRTMRILEWLETAGEGWELAVSVALELSLAAVASDATGSWAADDSPTSIHANRAAVLIPEMVRMSASSFIPAGDFGCLLLLRKGGFPDRLPARQRNDTDVSTFRSAKARTLFDVTKYS